jgi:hypothetical protein
MNKLIVICIATMLIGCAKPVPPPTITPCPQWPQPPITTIDKIQKLGDPEVDAWMVQLFKLKQQLKASHGVEEKKAE